MFQMGYKAVTEMKQQLLVLTNIKYMYLKFKDIVLKHAIIYIENKNNTKNKNHSENVGAVFRKG